MSDNDSVIMLDATPAAITFSPERSAIVVVDMENDFAAKGGMFDRAGFDISVARETIAVIARLLPQARQAGLRIVYLVHAYRPDLSDIGDPRGKNALLHHHLETGKRVPTPDGSEGRILIRDTWNTRIVDELAPEPGDLIVYKSRFSGFYDTDLDERLRSLGIDTLFLTGTTTSVCVDSTLRDASFRDYVSVLLSDCVGETLGKEFHNSSSGVIAARLGWVSTSDGLIEAINTAEPSDARSIQGRNSEPAI